MTAMKNPSRTDHDNPYSPLSCLLLLLVTGVAVKTAAAFEFYHMAHH
jgi:hypothetical protein